MEYFSRITSKSDVEGKENVVIMGRKTWFSIPAKWRPLKNRINVVISRKLTEKPEGAHYLAKSLQEAIDLTTKEPLVQTASKMFIVGGQEVYKEAIEHPTCFRIYLTRVHADYECDAFFPVLDTSKFSLISDPDVPEGEQEENGIKYNFELYQKI